MADTISDLIRRKAHVRWFCELECYGDLYLEKVRARLGPDASLDNRRPPCPAPGCVGRVRFKDISRPFPISLDTISDRSGEYWAYQSARYAELEAAGCRLEMGRWLPPDAEKASPP